MPGHSLTSLSDTPTASPPQPASAPSKMGKIRRLFSRSTLRSSADTSLSQPSIPISRESLLSTTAATSFTPTPTSPPSHQDNISSHQDNISSHQVNTSSHQDPSPPPSPSPPPTPNTTPTTHELHALLAAHIPALPAILAAVCPDPAFAAFATARAAALLRTLCPADFSTPPAARLVLRYFWHYKLAPVLAALARSRALTGECVLLAAKLGVTVEDWERVAGGSREWLREHREEWVGGAREAVKIVVRCRELSAPVRAVGVVDDWERVRGVFDGASLTELQLLLEGLGKMRDRMAAVVAVLVEG
ncbi:hypothetical protein B0H67DRAFT_549945 [Lasiosphaeris hirsuta]|uniref:Uncharacterized protein n=1 Tax=Lasiosphaeris hirsuta TaxID=260670 RepID=A0AA40E207_9PEZI|nr:hypothetical protein B0H67DRAFT_549945 [Lasiosphaeris hirsuta]